MVFDLNLVGASSLRVAQLSDAAFHLALRSPTRSDGGGRFGRQARDVKHQYLPIVSRRSLKTVGRLSWCGVVIKALALSIKTVCDTAPKRQTVSMTVLPFRAVESFPLHLLPVGFGKERS